ncbi:MAG: hydroxymethylglutaryl-CoA lyase [Rhizobiales bacterium]|nr:hydroxymethylglutaryl-CoA lyase [Hyphomicrobiales bacterium]
MRPQKITISEVGPRDGLQIERRLLPAEQKIALIDRLSATGLTRIEVSAFVHPKVVPQMADAEAVFAGIMRRPGVRYAGLVMNARGAERAVAASVDDIKTGIAVSDSFNELNVRMTTEQGMRALGEIAAVAKGTRSRIVGGIATAFGCPYEGPVPIEQVHRLFAQLAGFGAPVIYLADTTGMANPASITRTIESLRARWPNQPIGLHLHNTRGLGLANALAGLELGVVDFESSIGGLGGCPFAPRAVGNICTEDFVHMAHEMGIGTGVDLDALLRVAAFTQEAVGRPLPGMVMKAGKANERHDKAAPRMKVD